VCKKRVIDLVTEIETFGLVRPQYECQHQCDVAGKVEVDNIVERLVTPMESKTTA